jgi:hypothetical protein
MASSRSRRLSDRADGAVDVLGWAARRGPSRRCSIAGSQMLEAGWSCPATRSRPWSCWILRTPTSDLGFTTSGDQRMGVRSRALGLPVVDCVAWLEAIDPADHLFDACGSPAWPCSSRACLRRRGSHEVDDGCSGWPVNFLRSWGPAWQTPTGQVFRWHLRIMMQPSGDQRSGCEPELFGAQQGGDDHVAARLQPAVGFQAQRVNAGRSCTSVWCVSARPSSQGRPACLMLVRGDAPVPPS